jgi:hypothetical protein
MITESLRTMCLSGVNKEGLIAVNIREDNTDTMYFTETVPDNTYK